MIQQIQDLVRFYAQKYHTPIDLLTERWQLDTLDSQHIIVALPSQASDQRVIADMIVAYDIQFAKSLSGDLITVDDVPMARVGRQWLVLLFWPKNPVALAFVQKLFDQHLPKICRQYRHQQKDALVEAIASCVQDRKKELQSSIREDSYELERLSLQQMQLARKLETDRQVLRLFEKAPEWIKARSMRTFVDMMKLVPAVYASFHFEDESVVGTTHPIDIEYEDYTYHFDSYQVEVNLRQGKVLISGGTNVNGYVHPHVTDESSNICWGNISHLVSRLAGELDLFGLFQLVHQFLTTYNENDPYQKIEKWDSNWEEPEDEDDPYCSFCDDYGHFIGDCDSCWWCDHCNEYVDHDEEDCPTVPKKKPRRKPMQLLRNKQRETVALGIKLQVDAIAIQKLWLWTDAAKGEVSCLGLVEEMRDVDTGMITALIVSDFFLVKQQSSFDETIMDPAAVAALMVDLEAQGIDSRKLRCWAHSHGDLSVFWSGTDDECITGLANCEWLLSLVVNKRRDAIMRLDQYHPCHMYLSDVAWEVRYPLPDGLAEACLDEFKAKVTESNRIFSNGKVAAVEHMQDLKAAQDRGALTMEELEEEMDWMCLGRDEFDDQPF